MISVQGIPVTNMEVWGWPWHGQISQQNPEGTEYALRRHDGALWPLYNADPELSRISPDLFWRLSSYAGGVNGSESNAGYGGTTHLVKAHGHVFTPRTPEQVAVDQARSHEWCGGTMLCGINHALYMTNLGWYHWIYSLNGQRWQMQIAVDSVPHPLSNPTAALTLTISARPFGRFDVPGAWVVCGSVTAPSCCTPGFAWFTPGITLATQPPVLLQSIRSDGGKLILEVRFWAMEPSRMQSAAVGFYELDVANIGVDVWQLELGLLKGDTQIITKALTQSALAQGTKNVGFEVSQPDATHFIYTPIIQDNGNPTALRCVGLIVQEQRRHCGYVFDADDVLHELVCVIRASHNCSVADDAPLISGTAIQTLDGSGNVISATNDITAEDHFSNSVETALTVEIERDGSVVSSVSCSLVTGKTIDRVYHPITVGGQDPFPTPPPADVVRTATLTVGSYQASYTKSNSFASVPGGDLYKWPDAGLFDGNFFSSRSGVTLTPWPSSTRPGCVIEQPIESRTYFSNGGSSVTNAFRIRLGAARLSNNVFVPVIVAGMPAASLLNRWDQISDGWSYTRLEGMPATVFGALVGPDINGPTPAAFEPVAGVGPQRIEGGAYDYLHQVVLPYADIF